MIKYEELKQSGVHLISEFYGEAITPNWNDLWKVIDKIEALGYELNYYHNDNNYSFAIDRGTKTLGSYIHKNRIEALYMTIIFFINSYNAQFHPERRWR